MLTSTLPISLIVSNCNPSLRRQNPELPIPLNMADVVSLAQAGDHDAFSKLYSAHKKRVFSICLRMVREFSLAEDLTQETFLQLHRKLASFRAESAFTTWLHRMAVNTVLMHLRKRVLPSVSLDQLTTDAPDDHSARSFGARDLAQAGAVDRVTINRAVATLAPGYRSIFLLHDVQGLNHHEIATILKCSAGNTKSQLHKARRAMRGALSLKDALGSIVEPGKNVNKLGTLPIQRRGTIVSPGFGGGRENRAVRRDKPAVREFQVRLEA
jgi:RNA polymerase sigma-70 factor (ECF subfamily)